MPDIAYRAEIPAADDFVRLFRGTGWDEAAEIPADRLAASLPASWYGICAYDGARLVGMGLILSDGVLHALIVDLIVEPAYQGRGIGSEIMRRLVGRCRDQGVLQVQLFSARGKRGFYEAIGFEARPDEGPGMELREPS